MSVVGAGFSANADRGHAFSVGRQYAGQQPFSHQNGPMTAHHFGLLPDPTRCRHQEFSEAVITAESTG